MSKLGPSIIFEQLSLKLGGNSILADLDFEVKAGTIHCIIGPNGGGKTSLLRSLLGQMPHDGTIKILWQKGREVLGYVPQTLDYDRTLPLTVNNFMAMICQLRPVFMRNSKKKQAVIMAALERVGMAQKADYLFGGLSGGERQRVLLAQALIPAPDLLILDEPASGLDKKGSEIMHAILQELRDGGSTILMIHHDLGEVKAVSDQVTCINQRILFTGSPASTLTPENILNIYSSTRDDHGTNI
ncbi:MAG: manganese ABC transporter ATP-binding protein [Deltaproteobacteria bacterium]|nr:MAG: manganese ABC transporter ATP-binding protein [Deltaproteobacteria bacterium]